jgi:type VI secretion system protein ImpM
VSWFGKKPRSDVGNVGGFGKVPALGDFVRTPSPSDEMIAFESWLTTAMETAEARVGTELRERFATLPAHAFIWSGAIDKKMRGVFAGVIGTSNDAVGRRFPIVIGAPLPLAQMSANPHTAPLFLADFFAAAADAMNLAKNAKSAADFQSHVTGVEKPPLDGIDAAKSQYATWAKGQSAKDTWTALFGSDSQRLAKSALSMVVEACTPYRGQDLSPSTLGVLVPFDGPRTNALWIDVVRNAAGWRVNMPTVFFPLTGSSRRALIQLGGEAPSSMLADLYVPSDGDNVCDVTIDAVPPSIREEVLAASTIADVITEISRA